MADPVVLKKANPLKPAEDYDLLRKEGIKHIEKLSGNIWTDYNTHDPGITLLEALCYAITDLTYRTGFEMKDLVAPANTDKDSWKNIFYTAREILPSNPVTLNDFRKLLIDIDGVRNAWITISRNIEVPLYISYPVFPDTIEQPDDENPCGKDKMLVHLTYDPDQGDVRNSIIELNGLYKIIIQYERDITEKKRDEVHKKVLEQLHSHRSLCEDFLSVSAAEYKNFNLQTIVALKEDADPEKILAEICFRVQNYFTPGIRFYTYEELLEKGKPVEEIFEGPALENGFIPDDELEKTDFFRDMRLSDILNEVADINGIIALQKFRINDNLLPDDPGNPADLPPFDTDDQCSNEAFFDEWIAGMKNDQLVGRLDIDSLLKYINDPEEAPADTEPYIIPVILLKSGQRLRINTDRFQKLLKDLHTVDQHPKLAGHYLDLDVPAGQNMNLAEYYPVQYSLPQTYKVGEEGLPRQEGDRRLVQALQLKGYLAVFEQLFLNFLSGLNSLNKIFSFNEIDSTAFAPLIIHPDSDNASGYIEEITGYLQLYTDAEKYVKELSQITENEALFQSRRNKVLDHLLARFAEQMDEYTSLMKYLYPKEYLRKVIRNKTDLLADYQIISRDRSRAYNYKLSEEGYDSPGDEDEEKISRNVSGLIQRISRLLGMKDFKRKYISPDNLIFEPTNPDGTRGRIRLYGDANQTIVLLESPEIKTDCEDDIMHCLIETGCCEKNFIRLPENKERVKRKRGQHSGFSFLLQDAEGRILATSPQYRNAEEREKALKQAAKAIELICHNEGMHLVEHILLRPKGDNQEEGPGNSLTGYELLDVCLDRCDQDIGLQSPAQLLYKFNILVLKGDECIDNKRWRVQLSRIRAGDIPFVIFQSEFKIYEHASSFISSLREYGSEFDNFRIFQNENDDYFFRLLNEEGILLSESNTCYVAFTPGQFFKKKDIADDEKIKKCNHYEVTNVWTEIRDLKEFLSFEQDLYCCEDPCDHNEDPYSFRLSFILPCWPKRFRDKSFRRLAERIIRAETPAHIHPKIYWLGIEQMRVFENTYIEWIYEMSRNDVPDIGIANDFIKAVKELRNCDQPCKEEEDTE